MRGKHFVQLLDGHVSWRYTTLVNVLAERERRAIHLLFKCNVRKKKKISKSRSVDPCVLNCSEVLTYLDSVCLQTVRGSATRHTQRSGQIHGIQRTERTVCRESCVCTVATRELWINNMMNYSCLLVLRSQRIGYRLNNGGGNWHKRCHIKATFIDLMTTSTAVPKHSQDILVFISTTFLSFISRNNIIHI